MLFISHHEQEVQKKHSCDYWLSGIPYKALKKSHVIFICMFDLFGQGRYIYQFENLCQEDPSLRLGDETEKIFLNVKGNLEEADEELKNLLEYFRTLVPQDDFTGELEAAVLEAREHKEWGREFMKLTLLQYEAIEEGRKEGREEGWKEGQKEGRKVGEMEKLVKLVCRKMAKGKLPKMIAEELEEDLEEVRRIYDVAVLYAPDYDVEEILQKLMTSVKPDGASSENE